MKQKQLDYHRQIVPTLEGIAIQAHEEHWFNEKPLYEMKRGGVTQIISYRRMNDMYQAWKEEQ